VRLIKIAVEHGRETLSVARNAAVRETMHVIRRTAGMDIPSYTYTGPTLFEQHYAIHGIRTHYVIHLYKVNSAKMFVNAKKNKNSSSVLF